LNTYKRPSIEYAGPCQKVNKLRGAWRFLPARECRKYEGCFRLQRVEWAQPRVGEVGGILKAKLTRQWTSQSRQCRHVHRCQCQCHRRPGRHDWTVHGLIAPPP